MDFRPVSVSRILGYEGLVDSHLVLVDVDLGILDKPRQSVVKGLRTFEPSDLERANQTSSYLSRGLVVVQ